MYLLTFLEDVAWPSGSGRREAGGLGVLELGRPERLGYELVIGLGQGEVGPGHGGSDASGRESTQHENGLQYKQFKSTIPVEGAIGQTIKMFTSKRIKTAFLLSETTFLQPFCRVFFSTFGL